MNTRNSLLPAGPKQRGFDDPLSHRRPPEAGDELVWLAQHALVNYRIANHARTPIGLGLAGFELRFD